MVKSEPMETWKDWLAFHTINQEASVLPKAFDDAYFGFYGKTLTGTPAPRPRDKRGIASVNGALGDAVGKIYAQRYFPASVARRDSGHGQEHRRRVRRPPAEARLARARH